MGRVAIEVQAALFMTISVMSCGEPKSSNVVTPKPTESTRELETVVHRLGGVLVQENQTAESIVVNLRGASLEAKQLEELSHFQSVVELILGGSNIGDDAMAGVAKLKNLRRLDLSMTLVTCKGVALLEVLPSMTHLDLSDTRIHDLELECVRRLEALKVLDLDRSQTTMSALQVLESHKGLEEIYVRDERNRERLKVWARGLGTKGSEGHWKGVKATASGSRDYDHILEATVLRLGGRVFPDDKEPESYFVNLSGVSLEGKHLEELSRFQSIVDLRLGKTRVDDTALASIVKLKNLRFLGLSRTLVTAEGISLLGELPSLCALDLSETKIHGSDFSIIENLRTLKELWLDKSQTTKSALRHFDRHKSLEYITLVDEVRKEVRNVWMRGLGIKGSERHWKED